MKQRPKITYTEVESMLDNGHSKKEIAMHYGLNMNQITLALKKLGLSNKRSKKIDFDVVDDRPEAVKAAKPVEGAKPVKKVVKLAQAAKPLEGIIKEAEKAHAVQPATKADVEDF
jgi:hypothetical protein